MAHRRSLFWGSSAVGLLALCATSFTQAREAPSQDAQTRVRAAVAQGRKLAAQGKNSEAITAFQSALAVDPQAVKALSELGLAHYRLGQYAEGEAATRKAIRAAVDFGQRGRSLYNLGIILEAKGDGKGAIAALADSLKARPNQVVLERLRKLDGALAATLDPIAPRTMRGPFASVSDLCGALNDCKTRMEKAYTSAGPHFSCQVKKPLAMLAKPVAPFRMAQLVEAKCGPAPRSGDKPLNDTAESTVYLIVQTDKGFFAAPVAESYWDARGGSDCKPLELRSAAGAAGAPRIVARVLESGGRDVGQGSDSWEREKLTVAGIGLSGAPSATPPIEISNVSSEDEGDGESKPLTSRAKLQMKLDGDSLELTPATSAKSITEAQLVSPGTHALVFP